MFLYHGRLFSTDGTETSVRRRTLGGAGPLGNNPPAGGVGIGGAIPSPTGKGPVPIPDMGSPPPSLSPSGQDEEAGGSNDEDAPESDTGFPPEERLCSCHVPKEYVDEYGAEYILTSAGSSHDSRQVPATPQMVLFEQWINDLR